MALVSSERRLLAIIQCLDCDALSRRLFIGNIDADILNTLLKAPCKVCAASEPHKIVLTWVTSTDLEGGV